MGRNKIKIEKIAKDRTRNITFLKRKKGLVKKAMELSILCGTEILLCIKDRKSQCLVYHSYNDYIGFIKNQLENDIVEKKFVSNIEFSDDDSDSEDIDNGMLNKKRQGSELDDTIINETEALKPSKSKQYSKKVIDYNSLKVSNLKLFESIKNPICANASQGQTSNHDTNSQKKTSKSNLSDIKDKLSLKVNIPGKTPKASSSSIINLKQDEVCAKESQKLLSPNIMINVQIDSIPNSIQSQIKETTQFLFHNCCVLNNLLQLSNPTGFNQNAGNHFDFESATPNNNFINNLNLAPWSPNFTQGEINPFKTRKENETSSKSGQSDSFGTHNRERTSKFIYSQQPEKP